MRFQIPRGTGLAARFRLVWLFRVRRHLSDIFAMILTRRHGDVGWLIRTERRYAPIVEQAAGVTSKSNSGPYWVTELGGDKMAFSRNGYAPAYAELLRPWLGRRFVLAELGTFRGSSLALWSDLFPQADLIGLDIEFERFSGNLPTLQARGAFARTLPKLVEFDAFAPDTESLRNALSGQDIGVFIDDGPHSDAAILATATAILPLMTNDFLYIVEDNNRIASSLRDRFPEFDVTSRGALTVILRSVR